MGGGKLQPIGDARGRGLSRIHGCVGQVLRGEIRKGRLYHDVCGVEGVTARVRDR